MGTRVSKQPDDVELTSFSPPEEKEFPYKGDLFKDLDDEVKRLWKACQEPDLYDLCSIPMDLVTSEKAVNVVDKNGMNIFHALLFDQRGESQTTWYTKKLDTETRKKVVRIIEAICQKYPKQVETMMTRQDKYNRTPLHYAGIIDVDYEKEESNSNITLALLKYGADKGLFLEDSNRETPVSLMRTSNLKAHLDTKQRNEGPVGHKDQVALCDVSILKPDITKKNSLNFEYLEILAKKHRDLFDHPVISAMIWEKRKEYLWAIFIASIMKLLAFLLVLAAFGMRFGPDMEKETSCNLFYTSFFIEFSPLLINIYVVMSIKNFWCFFYHSKRIFLLSMLHFAVGIILIHAFRCPGTIILPYQKGLAGLYCICSAYCLFRTTRDLLQPTFFEMFGWFEVVFKNIIKLLAVHSWLLLTFVFAFYIQFSDFERITDQEVWAENCRTKLRNCTEIITTLNTTELKTEILDDCVDFFKECTQTETEDNPFNDWKIMFKALSMSAGELGFDDLPFDDNPIYVLTFVIFVILVLFVIMNLMTSLAVNDIHEIRNQSRDGTWYKGMFTLIWYHAALHGIKEYISIDKPTKDKNDNIIFFKMNEVPSLTDPKTWSNLLNRMPHSISVKAQKGGIDSDIFSIVHNMDNFEDIVIIFGTTASNNEVVLKKGEAHRRRVSYWKTKFAIVDYEDGYVSQRRMYRTQAFSVSGTAQLEIKFEQFTKAEGKGKFVVFHQARPDNHIDGTVKNYMDAEPSVQVKNAIEKYKIN